MSEFEMLNQRWEVLRAGPEWIAIDPFTDNERWVLKDSPEALEWMEKQAKVGGPRWYVARVDHENRTITLDSLSDEDPEC